MFLFEIFGITICNPPKRSRHGSMSTLAVVEMGVSKVNDSFSTVRVSVLFIHLVLLLLTDLS